MLHSTREIGEAVAWVVGIAIFVVVGLTQIPNWIAPTGEGAPEVGRTVK